MIRILTGVKVRHAACGAIPRQITASKGSKRRESSARFMSRCVFMNFETQLNSWNRTLVNQLVRVQHFQQSDYDPCYFWKFLSDGTRMDMVIYVDDGYVIDAFSAAADAELAELNAAFTITIKPAHFFLGNNIIVHDGSEVGAP